MKRVFFLIIVILLHGFIILAANEEQIAQNPGAQEQTTDNQAAEEEASQEEGQLLTFQGLLIFFSDSTVEVKRGDSEMIFAMTDTTSVMQNDAQAGRENLQVCQMVRVTYTNGESPTATRIEIIQESRCIRQ
jgi:hypothetical protein